MNTNPSRQGALTVNSIAILTVTRKMVRIRAVELAFIDGRTPQEVSPADWEWAKRELAGKPDMVRREEILESTPESERWDPVPISNGQKVQAAASGDKDTEGHSNHERLVERGIRISARASYDLNHDAL